MNQISQELFCSILESLRLQFHKDKEYSETLCTAFNINDGVIPCYDNSVLIKVLVAILQRSFPKDANGFCDIEHYIYDLNFGKAANDGECLITPEELFYRLSTKNGD